MLLQFNASPEVANDTQITTLNVSKLSGQVPVMLLRFNASPEVANDTENQTGR
jgi:hypothetical protein